MYVILPIFLFFLLVLTFFFHFRKKRLVRKICILSVPEKVYRLNCLLSPFGFEYQTAQDIFLSSLDAWQRGYGYCQLYDLASPGLGMVFDCEPVYFDCQGKTWLLEFWKGQYGISTGAEIGIYQADTLLTSKERSKSFFHTVPDEELPLFELELKKGTVCLYHLLRRHWWLAGFCVGRFSDPELLTLTLSVTFSSFEMLSSLCQGLLEAGYSPADFCVCGRRVSLTFSTPHTIQPRKQQYLLSWFSQFRNRILLWLYEKITSPFCFSLDQLLYLSEYLPFLFRRVICLQKKISSRRMKRR